MSDTRPAATVMRQSGSTFALAARLLPKPTADRVARLYAVCRRIDDLADLERSAAALPRLTLVGAEIGAGRPSDPLAAELRALHEETGLDLDVASHLIDGVIGDLGCVRIADVDTLLRYAYRVAGTVGVMMTRILGADAPAARLHAVDLGVAMQLTNIARDVMEDARAGRRYLPGTWIAAEPDVVANAPRAVRQEVSRAILRLLDLADRFYASGFAGLGYLPLRARLTVSVAGHVYREIGECIRERDAHYWEGRTVVPTDRRLRVASRALVVALTVKPPRSGHDHTMHRSLQGLFVPAIGQAGRLQTHG
jgi:phytoene synthase